jgi:4'-phosphopantetheinyl transferase
VWSVELAQPAARVAELEALLSADERERAARLADRARWVVARAALRTVLARELRAPPETLRFALGAHGKPELPGAELRFNLSHSGDRALIAVAGAEVGVDVERTARRSRAVERTLTAGERAALTGPDRHVELLRIWCRKEALAKALGGGLGWAPEDFDTTRPDGHVLADLDPGEGYVGAVAVAGDALELELRVLDH